MNKVVGLGIAVFMLACAPVWAQLKMPAKQVTVDSSSTNAAFVNGNSSTTLQQVVEFYDPKIRHAWDTTQLIGTNPANTEVILAGALFAKSSGVQVSGVTFTVNGPLVVTGATTLAQSTFASVSTTGTLASGDATVGTLTTTGLVTVAAGGVTVTAGGITAAAGAATVGRVSTTGTVATGGILLDPADSSVMCGGLNVTGRTSITAIEASALFADATITGRCDIGILMMGATTEWTGDALGATNTYAVFGRVLVTGDLTVSSSATLPTNSVGSNTVANGSIYSRHIADGAITNTHLGTGAVSVVNLDTALINAVTPTNTAFLASISTNCWTTNSVSLPVVWDFEEYDGGGNYDPVTGIYTAPSAGMYMFGSSVRPGGFVSTNEARQQLMLVTNSAVAAHLAEYPRLDSENGIRLSGTVIVPMASGATARVQFYFLRADGQSEYIYGTNAAATRYVSGRFWGHRL